MSDVLQRQTVRTSRLLVFFAEKELVAQTGHYVSDWPFVVIKELIDNALDACEEAGVAPVISVTVNEAGIEVTDNGPCLPADTIKGVLDTVQVSSREAYVSVTRVAQGNALKTIVGMPFALDPGIGTVLEIDANGVRQPRVSTETLEATEPPVSCHVAGSFPVSGRTRGMGPPSKPLPDYFQKAG